MNKNINSLFIIPNLNQGGSQKLIINLINKIKIKDKKLFVYKKNEIFLKDSLKKNIEIVYSKKKRITFSFFEIKRLIDTQKINLVFSCIRNMNIIIGLFSYFFSPKIKIVFHEPNVMDEFKNSNLSKLIKLNLMRLSYKNSHYIIANSEDTKKDLLKYKIINKKKIIVISNPISVDNKKYDNIIKIKKFIGSRYSIVGCGALTYQKNFELLIKSFSLFNNLHKDSCLIIVGNGPDKDKLINLINNLNMQDKIMITGLLKNPFPVFKLSQMFVLSSHFEGFGNVLIEAIFAKLKIVSTNCPGGPKEILKKGKYGYLAKNNNEIDLFKKMKKCYENPKKINLKFFKNLYSSHNISKKYLKVFEKK